MKIYSQALFIKRINLQDEARLIKRRERKLFARGTKVAKLKKIEAYTTLAHRTALSLKRHRKGIVSTAAREAHLAHGFLMGTPYARMEYKTFRPPNFDDVFALASRMAHKEPLFWREHRAMMTAVTEQWTTWVTEAKAYIKAQPERADEELAMKAAAREAKIATRNARAAAHKSQTAAAE